MQWSLEAGKMFFQFNGLKVELKLTVLIADHWHQLTWIATPKGAMAQDHDTSVNIHFSAVDTHFMDYDLSFESDAPRRLRLELSPTPTCPTADCFHLIPACIFGDNNHAMVHPNEFPTLAQPSATNKAAAELWEFRADRASHPVSMVCASAGIFAISIDPYSADARQPDGFIRNGVLSRLPAGCGVSLGYGNTPFTFLDKRNFQPPTQHLTCGASAKGTIYIMPRVGRQAVHKIIRRLYSQYHDRPRHQATPRQGIEALARAFIDVNFSDEFNNYSNLKCQVPTDTTLRSWRPLTEIGWTGGSVLAYPLLLAQHLFPDLRFPKPPAHILDDIVSVYHHPSGFFRDVYGPTLVGMPPNQRIVSGGVNGWWSGFMPSTQDRHCAYTNAHAAYYLLKASRFVERTGGRPPTAWLEAACKVLRTAMALQRDDGAFGYTFHVDHRAVDDWNGFAGCWFVPALVLAANLTGETTFLAAARRGLAFYAPFVRGLNCWGTPMDTWKSVDQEGVLAFIIGARLLHELYGEDDCLELLAIGAEYEFLWRYGFKARPELPPLKNSPWNSCGGSVTSVSNPHIHPMGLVITDTLFYLADQTGDDYFRQRAQDAVAWILNTMELYPSTMGYGRYGVLSERFCPSDGLTIDTFADTGKPASTWWSYNGWAAANVLEGLAEHLLNEGRWNGFASESGIRP